jgi:glycosyltransferase involved in cell wall biosynthesis
MVGASHMIGHRFMESGPSREIQLKVLHVIPSIGPLRGGPSFVIRTMSEGLAAQGCEIDVATTDDNGPERRLDVPLGRPVWENDVTYWYFSRQMRFYTVSWPLSQWLGRHVADYDVVHIHALFSFAVTSAAYWARHSRVPYVVRPLGTLNRWGIENRRPWLKQAALRLIDGRVLSNASAVHYTTEEEQKEGDMVASETRPVIIPNPVDFQIDHDRLPSGWLKSHYPAIAERRIILFLSRLHPKKGIDLLLSAFARLRAKFPDIALVVCGAGEERFVAQLRRHAHELGIEPDVVWAGFLEGDAKKAVMAEASIFVLPSHSENFGVAVVEAMAAGLPVIVSDRVGIHCEISAADAGLVVPCEQDSLANAILQVLGNEGLRLRLAQNGIALAKTFSVAAVTDQLVTLYRDIISSNEVAK